MEKYNLVIQTAFIGDLLLTIPLLKSLRETDPNIKTVLLCRKEFGGFFIHHHLVDKIVEVKKGANSNWGEVTRELLQYEFEKVISPHQSLRTAFLVFKLSAKEKIGFKKLWNFFAYNKRINWRKDLPEALRLLALVKEVNYPQNYLKMTTDIPEGTSLELDGTSTARERIVFLAPGSVWATKMWPVEGFTQVAKWFLEKGYRVKVVGTNAESHLADIIVSSTNGSENLCGKTSLPELYNLFRKGQLLVSNDSGAMHMATVAGLPVVAIFGPTVLDFGYRPWATKAAVVEKQLSCRPCGLHGAQKCPIGTHECMRGISAQKVIDAAQSFL